MIQDKDRHVVVPAADRAAREAILKADPRPTGLPSTQASGALPYGGSFWSGYSPTSQGGDGFIHGCSWGLSLANSAGSLFGATAGHCFKTTDGTKNTISPTTGQFWYPYTDQVFTVPPNIGNAGHAGSRYDGAGDHGAIRVNLKAPLYSEVGTFDSRGAITITGTRNPVRLESASLSGGKSRRLIHGFVSVVNTSTPFVGHPTSVGNMAILRVDNTTEGCSIPGDSGGAMVASDHAWLGTLAGSRITNGTVCELFFDQGQNALNAFQLGPAPAPPA
jgi:hypothetical protein